MPKKRKKARKAPQKRASVRTAPAQPARLELVDWDDAPERDIELLEDLGERFPAPVDAVKAVQAGERVEWTGSIDGSTMRHRVLLADDGTAVVEQAVVVGGPIDGMPNSSSLFPIQSFSQASSPPRKAVITHMGTRLRRRSPGRRRRAAPASRGSLPGHGAWGSPPRGAGRAGVVRVSGRG